MSASAKHGIQVQHISVEKQNVLNIQMNWGKYKPIFNDVATMKLVSFALMYVLSLCQENNTVINYILNKHKLNLTNWRSYFVFPMFFLTVMCF